MYPEMSQFSLQQGTNKWIGNLFLTNQPTPPNVPPPRNKGLIKPYVFTRPAHKAGYFWTGCLGGAGLLWLMAVSIE